MRWLIIKRVDRGQITTEKKNYHRDDFSSVSPSMADPNSNERNDNACSAGKGLRNNYLEQGGIGKLLVGWGIGENDNKREKRLDVKFNTYRGALLFHSFCKLEKK